MLNEKKSIFKFTKILSALALSGGVGTIPALGFVDGNSFAPSSNYAKKQFKSCGEGQDGAFLFVNVEELKSAEGSIRVHVYDDKPKNFLKSGKGFKVDVKAKSGENLICVPMPMAGQYAVAVMHDINHNKKADIFTDGFAFSNNPKLGLSKPKHETVMVSIPDGVTSVSVYMKYLFSRDKKKTNKRRKMRR